MNLWTDRIYWFALSLEILLLPSPSGAVGLRPPNQDPEAIARGNAFVGTADNASAIYYNPAGITQLEGQNVQAGLYLVSPAIEYESPTGAKFSASSDFDVVPQFYYVFSPPNLPLPLSFGLGAYAVEPPFVRTAREGPAPRNAVWTWDIGAQNGHGTRA
jgi:long-chain fatty acid transport protein